MKIAKKYLERDYDLATYLGFQARVTAPKRKKPAVLASAQLADLKPDQLLRHNEYRKVWHANIGPILTPQILQVEEELDDIVDSNRQDGDKNRSAALIDAGPGLGKSTLAIDWAAGYHRRQIRLLGRRTDDGHDHIPVAVIRLKSKTTTKVLNSLVCDFYGLPGTDTGSEIQLGKRAALAIRRGLTRVILIDDLHLMRIHSDNGKVLSDALKTWQNDYPVTLLLVGVDILSFACEGLEISEIETAQTARRSTRLTLDPFQLRNEAGRETWCSTLETIDDNLVLTRSYPGMLADDLAGYLFARSSGHFQSLMAIIRRGCNKAMRTGEERLTADLLNTIRNDEAAEQNRKILEAKLKSGKFHAHPLTS